MARALLEMHIPTGASVMSPPDPNRDTNGPALAPAALANGPHPPSNLANTVIAVVVCVAAMRYAREFLIPVTIAFLLAYTLQPIVNRLCAVSVPRSVGAALVLSLVMAVISVAGGALRDDALLTLEGVPAAARQFSDALEDLHSDTEGAMKTIERIAREVNRIARQAQVLSLDPSGTSAPVVVATSSSVSQLVLSGSISALSAISTLVLSLLLVFFLLQAGDSFRRKLVQVVGPSLRTKRATIEVLNDINDQVQKYMFMLLVTNVLLGVLSWAAYGAVGLEHAAIWAIVAAVLHLVPYVGPLLCAAVTGMAAFTQFGTFSSAAWVAGLGLGIATLVGVFIVPWFSGRQARMNPTAIFLALLFFGWLWGAWGLLLGIPLTVIMKVVAERFETFAPVAALLSE